MSLTASNVPGSPVVTNRASVTESCGITNSFAKSVQHTGLHHAKQRVQFWGTSYGRRLASNLKLSCEGFWRACRKRSSYVVAREHSVLCQSTGIHNTEAKECVRHSSDCSDVSSPIRDDKVEDLYDSLLPEHPVMPEHNSTYSSQGLSEVCKFVHNDAKFVNERARNDIVLLSRGIMKLNDRACQDFAILGLKFLKLDARARRDTKKIDHSVKRKAESLHNIAITLRDKAQSKLKSVADKHWNDGALEADLRRADFLAKRRAMEDAFMALEFVKDIHEMMVSKMYKLKQGSLSSNNMMHIMLEKNGRTVDFLPGEVSTDRITAIQEAYWSMASVLSEADGVDYTDPEELELLVATLIDLDAMDGKSSVSLLAECSNSPDVSTRQALANALAAAPSMWTLGNAGMGALQRLAEDSNPAIAAAASNAINELKKQWEIEEGDSWRFTMNQKCTGEEKDDSMETY